MVVARNALAVAAHTVVLALCAVSPARAQSGSPLFEKGVESYRSGSYAEAQRLLREYVEANADRRDADPARLGEAYHHLGLMTPDPKLAEGYFLAVVQRYPTTPVADESLARLGELYTAQGDHTEARRQWQALGRDYPLSRYVPEVDLQVGQTYFAVGDLEPAYSSFSAGFAKMKGFQRSGGQGANLRTLEGDYVYWLGRTLLARGAYGDARKYLNLVLLDYPDHPVEALALYHLSEAYRQEGKEKEARSAWQRFSEAVRNTSLEPVAENPNLVAIARARVSGDLASRSQREAASAAEGGPEGATTAAGRDELGDETASDMGRPTYRGEPEYAAETEERRADEAGDDEGFGPAAEAGPAPSENEGLRAPEPGRPGGVVANEPLGRRVETPAASEEEGAEASETQAAAERAVAERAAEEAAAAKRVAEDRAREAQVLERAGEVSRTDEQGRVSTGRPEPLPQIRPEGPRLPEPAGAAGTPKERILAEATERPGADPKAEAGTAPGDGPEPEDAPGAEPAEDSAPSPDAAAVLEPIPPGSVYLQAGAFTNASSAAQLSTQLRKRGFEPQINPGLVEGQAFYRVRFGPFEVPSDRQALEAVRERLKKAGFEAFVRRAEGAG